MREPWPVYGIPRVYADTSVIGGCEDDEFREPSRRLIEKCARGEATTLVVSSVTLDELEGAPAAVRAVLEAYDNRLEVIEATNEIENLADRYIELSVAPYPIGCAPTRCTSPPRPWRG